MDLSIIIVNYETYELTKQTINSVIKKNNEFSFEIIVVDNCSKDNSYDQLNSAFEREVENQIIKFIANDKNDGFKGNPRVGDNRYRVGNRKVYASNYFIRDYNDVLKKLGLERFKLLSFVEWKQSKSMEIGKGTGAVERDGAGS